MKLRNEDKKEYLEAVKKYGAAVAWKMIEENQINEEEISSAVARAILIRKSRKQKNVFSRT